MTPPSSRKLAIKPGPSLWLPVWTCLVLLCSAADLDAVDLPSDWKNVQPIPISRTGLIKISVPLETLTAARAELEDLRLHDPRGREIPFLIERPTQPQSQIHPARNFQVNVYPDSTVLTLETGFTQSISGITLQTAAGDFLKAVQIEGSQNKADWKVLARGQPVFRQFSGASKLSLSIPSEPWRFLRLTLDDRRSRPIPVIGAQLHADAGAPAPAEPLAVSIVQRSDEPGQTRLVLRLGGANFSLAGLEVETPEPLFTRPVVLSRQQYEENEVRESIFFRDTLYRVALEGQPQVSNLKIGVDAPIRSPELLLTVQNDDNPPLQITTLRAQRRPIYLTFVVAEPGTHHLLSGNPQCAAPRYELGALKPNLQAAPLEQTSPGPLGPNASFRATDPLAGIQSGGTPLDLTGWQFRRRLHLAQDGAQQIELDLTVLAHASPSLRDLRLMQDGGQVPYVLERTPFSRSFTPVVSPADDPKRPAVSRWKLTLPCHPAPVTRVTCVTVAPYFKRAAQIYEERRDEFGNPRTASLGSATWVKSPGQKDGTMTLHLSSPPVTETLTLEIENGDNPPLVLQKMEAWYSVSRVLFKAASGSAAFLYYGNPRANPPQYDLELVVPRLLAAEKSRPTLGIEEKLAPGSSASRFVSPAGWIFWVALGTVVVALLFVIARLLPKPSPPAGP